MQVTWLFGFKKNAIEIGSWDGLLESARNLVRHDVFIQKLILLYTSTSVFVRNVLFFSCFLELL